MSDTQAAESAKRIVEAYTLIEAAEALRVSTWLLRAHLRIGTIKCTRFGKKIVFPAKTIERLLSDGLPKLQRVNDASA